MIEEQLARMAAAIEALNATLQSAQITLGNRVTASDIAKFADENTAQEGRDELPKPKPAPRAAKKETTTPTATTEEASEPTETETIVAIDYERDVKPLILKVGGTKGRDAALALLAEFEVKGGLELDPSVYTSFIARAKELLA